MAVTSTRTIVVGGRAQVPLALSRQLIARGVVTIAAGLLALAWPSAWLFTVTVVLGVVALAVGMVELIDGARRRRLAEDWGFEVGRGLLTFGLGLFLVAWPNLALSVLAVVVGAVWFVDGILEVVEGTRARRGVREGRWRILRGVVAVALAVAIVAWPSITATVLLRLVGALLVGSGVLCFVSARVLRDAGQNQRDVRLDIVS